MKNKKKTIARTVGLLVDPDPQFLSLVGRGANQTPWKFVKGDSVKKYLYKIIAKKGTSEESIKQALGASFSLDQAGDLGEHDTYTQFDLSRCKKGSFEYVKLNDDISLVLSEVEGAIKESGELNLETGETTKDEKKSGLFTKLLNKDELEVLSVNGGTADQEKASSLGGLLIRKAVYGLFDRIVDHAINGSALSLDEFQASMKEARELSGENAIKEEDLMPSDVFQKRGAKMSASRLKKLTDAVAEMQALVLELTESQSDKGAKDMEKEEIIKAINEAVAPLTARITELETKTKTEKQEDTKTTPDPAEEMKTKIASLETAITGIGSTLTELKKSIIGEVSDHQGDDPIVPPVVKKGSGPNGIRTNQDIYGGMFNSLKSELRGQ